MNEFKTRIFRFVEIALVPRGSDLNRKSFLKSPKWKKKNVNYVEEWMKFWDRMNEFLDKMKALGTFMRVRLPGNNIDIKAESLFGSGW